MERLDCEASRRVVKSQVTRLDHCRSRCQIGAANIIAAFTAALLGCAVLIAASQPAQAEYRQQKLIGTGTSEGFAEQGFSVGMSSDGNTAIVGGPQDGYNGVGGLGVGAAWVFTRNNGVWTQQGTKLAGNDAAAGFAVQGISVALSADGNTAAVGGPDDNPHGAVWVYTRSNGVWTQQGPKLVGTDLTPDAAQLGESVALSADGNTLIAGAPVDANAVGSAVVYVRSNGVWTQQGPKLVGTGGAADNEQGWSVALSADGNTAAIGEYIESQSPGIGGTWVFTRTNGIWTQQGPKLVGTNSSGNQQGYSVALSANGNTLAIGGPNDNTQTFEGAVWVFTRNSGAWTQQAKVVPTDFIVSAAMGWSVALSADGNTVLAGGPRDNSASVLARRGCSPKATGCGPSRRSWSEPAPSVVPTKAYPSRCLATAELRLLVGRRTVPSRTSTNTRGPRGSLLRRQLTISTATARATSRGATPAVMSRSG